MSAMNLLAADLRRLKKDKPLKVVAIINAALLLFTYIILKLLQLLLKNTLDIDSVTSAVIGQMFGSIAYLSSFAIGNLGFYIAISVCTFIGKDFSYNTIRNKLISGNSRTKVYLSTFATSSLLTIIFYVLNIVLSVILSFIFFGGFMSVGDTAIITALALPLYISIVAIMQFICMSLKNQALGIVFNLLIIMILPTILSLFSMIPVESKALNAVLLSIPYSLVDKLTTAGLLSFFSDAALTSDASIVGIDTSLIIRIIVVSVIYTAAAITAGILIFNNADIK